MFAVYSSICLQRSVHLHPNHITTRQNRLANSDSQLVVPNRGHHVPSRGHHVPRMQRLYIEMQGKSISSKVTDKGSSTAVCTAMSVVGCIVNVLIIEFIYFLKDSLYPL